MKLSLLLSTLPLGLAFSSPPPVSRTRQRPGLRESITESMDDESFRTQLGLFGTFGIGGVAVAQLTKPPPIFVAGAWCGVSLAISFCEAPVKFSAPFLPKFFALDVGRTVFPAINALEAGLCVTLWSLTRGLGLWIASAMLALQLFYVTPVLRRRAEKKILNALQEHPYIIKNVLTESQRATYIAALKKRRDSFFDRCAGTSDGSRGKIFHLVYIVAELFKLGGLLLLLT